MAGLSKLVAEWIISKCSFVPLQDVWISRMYFLWFGLVVVCCWLYERTLLYKIFIRRIMLWILMYLVLKIMHMLNFLDTFSVGVTIVQFFPHFFFRNFFPSCFPRFGSFSPKIYVDVTLLLTWHSTIIVVWLFFKVKKISKIISYTWEQIKLLIRVSNILVFLKFYFLIWKKS